MNWLDNVSSDSDQPIASAHLFQGHWRHSRHAFSAPELCRVVIDIAEPRVVAAQWLDHSLTEELDDGQLEDLNQAMAKAEVFRLPSAWGLSACTHMPTWAKATFSDSQIEELQRIEGYLIEASEDTIDSVLQVRDEFLRGIGMNDMDMHRAVRQTPQHGLSKVKGGRSPLN